MGGMVANMHGTSEMPCRICFSGSLSSFTVRTIPARRRYTTGLLIIKLTLLPI